LLLLFHAPCNVYHLFLHLQSVLYRFHLSNQWLSDLRFLHLLYSLVRFLIPDLPRVVCWLICHLRSWPLVSSFIPLEYPPHVAFLLHIFTISVSIP
jgi:hypothetical protein